MVWLPVGFAAVIGASAQLPRSALSSTQKGALVLLVWVKVSMILRKRRIDPVAREHDALGSGERRGRRRVEAKGEVQVVVGYHVEGRVWNREASYGSRG